jgi:hypothetical protein
MGPGLDLASIMQAVDRRAISAAVGVHYHLQYGQALVDAGQAAEARVGSTRPSICARR